MKVTYIDYYPKGSLLHPVYKVWETELTEHCDTIKKCGECYYMFRGGYVLKSIEVKNIKRMEFSDIVITCKYNRGDYFPFSFEWKTEDGKQLEKFTHNSTTFDTLLSDIMFYQEELMKYYKEKAL